MVEISQLAGVGASEGVAIGPVFVRVAGETERRNIPEDAVDPGLSRSCRL